MERLVKQFEDYRARGDYNSVYRLVVDNKDLIEQIGLFRVLGFASELEDRGMYDESYDLTLCVSNFLKKGGRKSHRYGVNI